LSKLLHTASKKLYSGFMANDFVDNGWLGRKRIKPLFPIW
jgi:hypothetical protein